MILVCMCSLAMVSGVFFTLIIFLSWLSFPWAIEILASSSDGHRHYQLYQAWHLLLVSNIPRRWCFSIGTTLSNMTFTSKVAEGWISSFLIIFTATGHFFIIPIDNLLVTPPCFSESPVWSSLKFMLHRLAWINHFCFDFIFHSIYKRDLSGNFYKSSKRSNYFLVCLWYMYICFTYVYVSIYVFICFKDLAFNMCCLCINKRNVCEWELKSQKK